MATLEIKLNIRGSTKLEAVFKPSMVNNVIKTTDIYFPENFKLDKANILNALANHSSDITGILTNIEMFTTLVNYNTKKHGFKKIAVDGVANIDIIKHNGEFMKKLWFVNNSKITIPERVTYNKSERVTYNKRSSTKQNDYKQNVYVIVSSEIKIAPKKVETPKNQAGTPNINGKRSYVMTINIMVSKETSAAAKFALTCPEKRNKIDILFRELFNTTNNFFDWRENDNSNRYLSTPAMFVNNVSGPSYRDNNKDLNWRRNPYQHFDPRRRDPWRKGQFFGGTTRHRSSRYKRRQTQKRCAR